MDLLLLIVLAAVTLAAAVYAQYRMPFHTATAARCWIARSVLAVTGVAFGWAMTAVYVPVEGVEAWLVFLSGFGLVHVPAAIILFLKRERRRELS